MAILWYQKADTLWAHEHHHLHDAVPLKALQKAVKECGLNRKEISCHTFRYSVATQQKKNG